MSDRKPGHLGGGGAFEVFGEAPASAEPCESTLDDPAPGQELDPFDPGWSLDDLDRPRAAVRECIDELFAAINPIGKDMPQSGKAVVQALQQRDGAMDILNVSGMNVYSQQQAVGIGNDVALAPVEALAGVKTAGTAGLCRRSCLAVDDASPSASAYGQASGAPARPRLGRFSAICRCRAKRKNSPAPWSTAEIPSARPATGTRWTGCRRSPARPRANRLPAGVPADVAAASSGRSSPTPHRSDRLRSATHCVDTRRE